MSDDISDTSKGFSLVCAALQFKAASAARNSEPERFMLNQPEFSRPEIRDPATFRMEPKRLSPKP